jgi:hypothetical protein
MTVVTDVSFHSGRRHFQQFAVSQGVKSYGYHFIDPAASPAPMYGGQFFQLRATDSPLTRPQSHTVPRLHTSTACAPPRRRRAR